MGNEYPPADAILTKVFWITVVGAVLFGAAVLLFVL